MNPVLFTVYDTTPAQHDLSVAAFESILAQDVPVHVYALDNGSTHPATIEWMRSIAAPNVTVQRYERNESPVKLHNFWLGEIFGRLGHEHILGVPNDVVLPDNCYREFLRWPRGIVTGSMTSSPEPPVVGESRAVNTCTPMAVALLRRWCYEALIAKDGFFFDPRLFHYCSDCDMALRIAACGITGVQLDLQYYHYGSASHKLADWETAEAICSQADDDRRYFEQKWGFTVESPEYSQRAQDINFRG